MRELMTLDKAKKLDSFPFAYYEKVGDLIEYEGAILSHFQRGDLHALYYWVDYNKDYNRWLCFDVTAWKLHKYLTGEVSLRDLVLNNKEVYLTDIDKDVNFTNFQSIESSQFPEGYLPEQDTFYKIGLTARYADYFQKIKQDK